MGEPVSSVTSSNTLADRHVPAPFPSRRHLVRAAWLSAAAATLLVLTELMALDAALAWAAGSVFALSDMVIWVLAAVGTIAALWVCYGLFRSALANELGLIGTPRPDA